MTRINSKHYDSKKYSVVSEKIKKDLCFVPECYEKSYWVDDGNLNFHLCYDHLNGDLEYLYMLMKNELSAEKYKYNRIKFAKRSSLKSIYSVVIEKWLLNHLNTTVDDDEEEKESSENDLNPRVKINHKEIVVHVNKHVIFLFHMDDEEEKSNYYPISPLNKFSFSVKKEYVNFRKYTCLHFSNNSVTSNDNESDFIFLLYRNNVYCFRIERLSFDNFTNDLYHEIELTPEASENEIQKTIRKKSIQCHPDKFPNNSEKKSEFQRIHLVKDLLLDTEKRLIEFEQRSGKHYNISSKINEKTLILNYLHNLVQNYNPILEQILKNNIILYQYLVGKHNHGLMNVMSMLTFKPNKYNSRTKYRSGFIIECLNFLDFDDESSTDEFDDDDQSESETTDNSEEEEESIYNDYNNHNNNNNCDYNNHNY